jgi:hypothetical protein
MHRPDTLSKNPSGKGRRAEIPANCRPNTEQTTKTANCLFFRFGAIEVDNKPVDCLLEALPGQ